MELKEKWKPVDGYEGIYLISNFGRFKTLSRKHIVRRQPRSYVRFIKERILRGTLNHGYFIVSLIKRRRSKKVAIHTLVANAFLPKKPGKPHINHLDGVKTNNFYLNLQRCTPAENLRHARETGLNPKTPLNRPGLSMPVLQYTLNRVFVKEFPSLNEVYRQLGIPTSNLWVSIKKGYKCKGFYWSFK